MLVPCPSVTCICGFPADAPRRLVFLGGFFVLLRSGFSAIKLIVQWANILQCTHRCKRTERKKEHVLSQVFDRATINSAAVLLCPAVFWLVSFQSQVHQTRKRKRFPLFSDWLLFGVWDTTYYLIGQLSVSTRHLIGQDAFGTRRRGLVLPLRGVRRGRLKNDS